MNIKLAWGRFKVWIKFLTGSAEVKGKTFALPPAVEDSLNLNTTKGEKLEAKIEGGDVEAVKYKPNAYAVEMEVRKGTNEDGTIRKLPFKDMNGVVDEEVELIVQPEDPTVEGFTVGRSHISVEDSINSKDGGRWKLTFDAMTPPTEGDPYVKWGVIQTPSTVTPIPAES